MYSRPVFITSYVPVTYALTLSLFLSLSLCILLSLWSDVNMKAAVSIFSYVGEVELLHIRKICHSISFNWLHFLVAKVLNVSGVVNVVESNPEKGKNGKSCLIFKRISDERSPGNGISRRKIENNKRQSFAKYFCPCRPKLLKMTEKS